MIKADWSLPGVLDVVTAAAPGRDMLVWGPVRRSYAEVRDRTRGLAAFLGARGLGVRRERAELDRWACGQSRVALVLSNCPAYVEAMVGAYRARAVPYNVNHHYNAREVAALLARVGADAVVYQRRLAPLLAEAPLAGAVLVDVDDGSGAAPLPGSVSFEDAVAWEVGGGLPEPSPDDLYLVCTGGTTGAPKAVLWRQADAYVSAMGGVEGATPERIAAGAGTGAGVWFAAPPLMHAAAQWTVFAGLHNGATVVLHDDAEPFDARTILATAEREGVTMMTIVGDAYARPIVDELRARPYDLSALRAVGTGGAVTSPALKRELLELVPHLTVNDGYGSSETGGMAFGASRRDARASRFTPSAGACVVSADRTRVLEPGDGEVGWTARTGRIPLGYLDDREATERTFPIVGGRRCAVPGDRATLAEDGTITVLGRDALVVNSGGEKVFVEEVEEAIRRHPDVADALVVGRPSERFGEEVVALVALRPGASLTPLAVREFAARSVARFKAPRAVLLCDRVGRHPSGKADYTWARRAAEGAVAAAPQAGPGSGTSK
ncbi:MAG TPA: AMP-binding protein [Acidimicrobiales bacterium]|nr:AMP-binding protein [Acidimicrobiales bacterium]